jgi:hypothetical protein
MSKELKASYTTSLRPHTLQLVRCACSAWMNELILIAATPPKNGTRKVQRKMRTGSLG